MVSAPYTIKLSVRHYFLNVLLLRGRYKLKGFRDVYHYYPVNNSFVPILHRNRFFCSTISVHEIIAKYSRRNWFVIIYHIITALTLNYNVARG